MPLSYIVSKGEFTTHPGQIRKYILSFKTRELESIFSIFIFPLKVSATLDYTFFKSIIIFIDLRIRYLIKNSKSNFEFVGSG
jgi:hypothetical protein